MLSPEKPGSILDESEWVTLDSLSATDAEIGHEQEDEKMRNSLGAISVSETLP